MQYSFLASNGRGGSGQNNFKFLLGGLCHIFVIFFYSWGIFLGCLHELAEDFLYVTNFLVLKWWVQSIIRNRPTLTPSPCLSWPRFIPLYLAMETTWFKLVGFMFCLLCASFKYVVIATWFSGLILVHGTNTAWSLTPGIFFYWKSSFKVVLSLRYTGMA